MSNVLEYLDHIDRLLTFDGMSNKSHYESVEFKLTIYAGNGARAFTLL